MNKICTICNKEKEIEKFVKHTGKYRNQCKDCVNDKRRTGKPHLGRFKKGEKSWNSGKIKIQNPDEKRVCRFCNTEKKLKEFVKQRKWFTYRCKECKNSARRKGPRKKTFESRFNSTYLEWQTKVKDRDGWKCVKCGSLDSLHTHHIKKWDDYPELRFDIDNGLTLCHGCHSREHMHVKGGWNLGVKNKYKGIPRPKEVIEKMNEARRLKKEGKESWSKLMR